MVRSRFLSRAILMAGASFTLCCTSCQDHEKIAKQTEEILKKVEDLQAQRDATEAPTGTLRSHPIARKGKKAMESAIAEMRSEVSSLEERRSSLEIEVASLQKDFADYRAKNP